MELVTGFAGTAHVDPVDSAHLNAAAFGPDAYLLDTQNKLEASLETANKLVINTGDLMIQGHHFTVVESEEVALQSGVSGQKRNALVCARYDKAEGTGVESASWVVKYGTSTTDTPTDPTVTTGNILDGVDSAHEEPIFRIEYDGITPGNPILLVPEFQSASKFRDSISLIESGRTDSIAVPAKSHKDVVVTFDKSFSSIPDVVCCLSASSTASDYGSMSAFVSGVTASSVTLRVVNNGSSERGPMIRWIAVGK